MRAVVMVLRGRSRRHWRSWLALSVLIAVAGGFVLGAVAAGRRTASAFPGFVARHGYDIVVYSSHSLPKLARLPEVDSATPVSAAYVGRLRCSSCRKPIDTSNFLILEVSPRHLPRMVSLLSGRMPDQSHPTEVLASYTLAQDNGVHIGSVIRASLLNPTHTAVAARPVLRVVGIAAAQTEFPEGQSPHYDLYTTAAFAAAVNHRAALLRLYYVRLRHGVADLPAFDSRLGSLGVLGTEDLDSAAAAAPGPIRPQAVGWLVLAGLGALAALAVIGQALARQAAAERSDHYPLAALGARPRDLVLLDLLRALVIGAAGAAGAVAAAVLVSPATPVGEPRLAVPSPGQLSFDPHVLPLGALAVLAAVIALAAWPAVRHARLRRDRPQPAATPARGVVAAGLPTSALIGVRHALERSSNGQPVATALFGTAIAITTLVATVIFGASLAHLVASPALYGEPFQVYFAPSGGPDDVRVVTGPLLEDLRRDRAIKQITLAVATEVEINGHQVQVFAMQPVRGPALLSAVDGRRPGRDREIMLGAATMRDTRARVGGSVRVRVTDPQGVPHEAVFRVVGRASLNGGAGGMGNGAAMTIGSLVSTQCPPGLGQTACQRAVRHHFAYIVLVRASPGPAGRAALARHIRKYRSLAYQPQKPTALVNFGQSVDFPVLFGVLLSLFGAATMLHLLLVSVARRRRETGLLKALGFVRGQVAAVFCWQATTVALVGVAVGAPAGIAVGKVLWRIFATNFGVVPAAVVQPLSLVALVAGVLAAANLLAAIPALLAARSHAGQLLRTE